MIACLMQEISELFSTVLLDFEHLTKHTIVPEGHFSKSSLKDTCSEKIDMISIYVDTIMNSLCPVPMQCIIPNPCTAFNNSGHRQLAVADMKFLKYYD